MTAERRPIRLNFWMTVCALPALMILIGLGTWQLQRLEWKEGIIAERAARLAAPPMRIAEVPASNWTDVEHRRIAIRGRYLHDREMLILNKVRHGQAGFELVTPMSLESGGHVLAIRGWVPKAWPDGDIVRRRPEGVVEVTGILRAGARTSPWVPDNSPATGEWFFADAGQMGAHAGLKDARPYFVRLRPSAALEGYPKGPHASQKIRNKHLEYVVTWYGLAASLVVIYVVYHVRRWRGAE